MIDYYGNSKSAAIVKQICLERLLYISVLVDVISFMYSYKMNHQSLPPSGFGSPTEQTFVLLQERLGHAEKEALELSKKLVHYGFKRFWIYFFDNVKVCRA